MKKNKLSLNLLSGILIGTLFTNVAGATMDYLAKNASLPVIVNGKTLTTDKPIVTIDGSTYLPLRAMGSALGVSIVWNESLKRVEVGKAPTAPTTTPTPKPPVTTPAVTTPKLYEAGEGFKFTQPRIKKQSYIDACEVVTEIHNNSGKDAKVGVMFTVSAYNKEGQLLGTTNGTVSNFNNGSKKVMSTYFLGKEYANIDYVTIQYDYMV